MKLEVYRDLSGNLEHVGAIETVSGDGGQFSYASSYLASPSAAALSCSLPLKAGPFSALETRPYFEGLLPEGGARTELARELGVRRTSYLEILKENGLECIGDIVIAPEGLAPEDLERSYVPLSLEDLEQSIKNDPRVAAHLQMRSRLSLAGAQIKTGLYHAPGASLEEEWYLPQGSAPSTHIIKFPNREYRDLIINEYLCLRTASASGITTPRVFLLTFRSSPEEPLLCIERYDRFFSETNTPETEKVSGLVSPIRRHQEDMCQAFGILPEDKYTEMLWGGLERIAGFLVERSSNALDRVALLRTTVFNYLIGNCDNHLKNLSIQYNDTWSGLSLAPLYDLVSTVHHEQHVRSMGMKIGNHRIIDEVTPEDFTLLAEQLGVTSRLVMREAQAVAENLEQSLSDAALGLDARGITSAQTIADAILRDARPRIELLLG